MSDEDFTFRPPAKRTSSEESKPMEVKKVELTSEASLNGRGKVALAPGYSQLSWMTKCERNKRLGIGNLPFDKDMQLEEIKKHNSVDDAWIIVRRKVYNLTPYLPYHPGGIEILQGVLGKDATSLFDKYHPWVNVDALLQACWVGMIQR